MPIQFPQRDLTNQFISTSYQDVVQRFNSASVSSYFLDGLGFSIGFIPNASLGNQILTSDATASYSLFAVSASFAPANSSVSSSYALSASYAVSASIANLAIAAKVADVAFLADTASAAAHADFATSASWASSSYTSSIATTSSFAKTASYFKPAGSDQQIQFNSNNSFAGALELTWDYGNRILQVLGKERQGSSNSGGGTYSHAEGLGNISDGEYSHAEGKLTISSGSWSHSEGISTKAIGTGSHAEGISSISTGQSSHAEGYTTTAAGTYSHTEGQNTAANGISSHAEGSTTIANGTGAHAEGVSTTATGVGSHTEGYNTLADTAASYAHVEGANNTATGNTSHAEGGNTNADGVGSHTEGYGTTTIGAYSHAEGNSTRTVGTYSHAEGNLTIAFGNYSHAEGLGTIASGSNQLTVGQYNTQNNSTSLFVIGNGVDAGNRSNLALFNSQSIVFNQPLTASLYGTASRSISSSYALTSSTINILAINTSSKFYLTFVTSSGNQQLYIDTGSIYYTPNTDTLFVNFITAGEITASRILSNGQLDVHGGAIRLDAGQSLSSYDPSGNVIDIMFVVGGSADVAFGGSNTNQLIFNTDFVEGFRVINNGNVLIGTVTDNGQKLQVAGTALIQDAGGAAVPNPDPNAVLVLDNGNNTTNLWLNIPPIGTFTNTTTVFGVSSNGGFLHGVVYNLESNYMIVTNDGGNGLATTGMAVDGAGNVGINTTAPAANLDVNGSLYTLGGTANGGIQITAFAGGSWVDLSTNGPSGIGTGGPGVNPFIAYVPVDTDWFTNALAGDVAYRNINGRILFGTADVSPYVADFTGSNFHVALSGGNVKIGTETDDGSGAILQVSGDVHATNFLGTFLGTASYATVATKAAINGIKAWAEMNYNALSFIATTYGCSVNRISVGLFGIILTDSASTNHYAVSFEGYSGSILTPTASIGYALNKTRSTFSMSIQQVASPLIRADFATASFQVIY